MKVAMCIFAQIVSFVAGIVLGTNSEKDFNEKFLKLELANMKFNKVLASGGKRIITFVNEGKFYAIMLNYAKNVDEARSADLFTTSYPGTHFLPLMIIDGNTPVFIFDKNYRSKKKRVSYQWRNC